MNIHCGTHMDAPFHFLDDGRPIDKVPLEQTYGPATLIRLPHHGSGARITREDLVPWANAVHQTGKAILATGWSRRWMQHDFFEGFPEITADAAEFLVTCGVHLVGVEQASVDTPPNKTHFVLLGNQVIIVECLTNLDQIPGETFLFSATPLKLQGRDGSPVRAVAILDE